MPETESTTWEQFEADDSELGAWYKAAEESLFRAIWPALEAAEAEHNARFLAEHPPPEGRDPWLRLTIEAQIPRQGTLRIRRTLRDPAP